MKYGDKELDSITQQKSPSWHKAGRNPSTTTSPPDAPRRLLYLIKYVLMLMF